ncbi:MAG: glycosyltransferase family 39 protein [Chloroflexi bacterium]|nr:glycosyltransferase family 39 protein [Chloroflexota bacterium]
MSTSNPPPALRRPSIPRRLFLALLALIGTAILFAIAAPQLWYPLWFDQGAFAACAQELQHGGVMYRDCWDVRGPAAALAYLIPLLASPSPVAVHVFDLLCQAGTAILLGLLARDMFGRRAGIVAGVLYWLLYASINYWATAQAESFANLFLVLALYGAWRGAKPSPPTPLPLGEGRGRFTWLLASGASIGVAFWFKYPFALVGLLPAALVLSGMGQLVSRPAKASTSASEPVSRPARASTSASEPISSPANASTSASEPVSSPAKASTSGPAPSSQAFIPLLQSFALIGVGCAAILLIGFGYFTLTGAISNFQSQLNYDITTFHNVPLSDRLEWLRTIFWEEVVAFVNFGNTPTAGFKDTVQQLTILGRGYPFVFLLMAWGLLYGLWKRRAATLYAFGYVAVAVAINLWQGHFYRYHFLIVLPAMALLASAADFRSGILDASRRFWGRRNTSSYDQSQSKIQNPKSKIVSFVLAIAAVIGLTATMLPWMRDAYENVAVQHKTPGDLYGESRLSSYTLVARALNEQTSPDDRIVVFSDVPAVYALAQRRSGTRFPYLRWAQESGSAELRDQYVQEFLDDLTRNQPRFFVLTQPDFPWPGADFIGLWKSLPAIHQYVEVNYHYVGENGPFLLFMRN